jgi:putative heme-binding domain-containing protein
MPDFHVPDGFVVERVAAPPLVRYPLFGCFDDRGRLYVAEGTGTNLPGEELRSKKLGRILLLEDSNGDGTFDTSKVFADGLVAPQGVLWHDGAVFTTSHPSLWKLEDPDGKGVATRRTELVSGFGFNGNGCDLHGPFLGPDGRLYWTDGRHGYNVTTRDGKVLQGLAARIWRCRTDGSDVERVCGGGFDNPVEIAFTADGDAIGTMDQGVGDCLLHYVEGGIYPMDHPCLAEFPKIPLLGAVRQYAPVLPAALCGLMRYRSAAFGSEYQDCLFSTHYMLHKIVRHKLQREGSTFRAQDHDFLTSTTHDLRLTDVFEDADGSILFVDMGAWFTYGFPGNPPAKPDVLGAIYRIRRKGEPTVAHGSGDVSGFSRGTADELLPLLSDARPMVQDHAIARLARIEAVPALETVIRARSRESTLARQNAVWALCRIETPAARKVLRRALRDPDPAVRGAAIHALGLQRDPDAALELRARLPTAAVPERRRTAEALGRIGDSYAVEPLLRSVHDGDDRFLEHAIVYALIRINAPSATRSALTFPDFRVRRLGLIALDQMSGAPLTEADVAPHLDLADEDLRRTALEIVARHPQWLGLTRETLRRFLASSGLRAEEEQIVTDILLLSAREPVIQNEVTAAVADAHVPAATKLVLLRAMARCALESFPERWSNALAKALEDPEAAIQKESITSIKARDLRGLDQRLAEVGRAADQPADVRIAALECLAGRLGPLDASAFSVLTAHLSEETDPLVRLAAARALGASRLTSEQLSQMAADIDRAGPSVLRLLLPVFAKGSDPGAGAALVSSLERSPSVESLSPAELDQTLRSYPAEVAKCAGRLRQKLEGLQKDKSLYLDRIAAELKPLRGDADAGQELFLSQRVGCYGCHRAVGRGGTIGPDLSRIGKIRTKSELLESFVFPGRTIAPEYRAFQVATKDGRVATGLIIRESTEGIVLRATDLSEVVVARKDLEAMTPSSTSLMPEGLEKVLTRQQLSDLLEFLSRQQ